MKTGYSEWHPSAGDWQVDAAWLAKFNACDGGLSWFAAKYGEQSVSARELLATVDAVRGDWAEWLVDAGLVYLLSLGKLPDGFTHCGGYLDLEGYGHALPDGFTHCGGFQP